MNKYKNNSEDMRLVAESLNEFNLNENMEEARKVFSDMGFDEKSTEWQDFEKAFEVEPELAGKFTSWAAGFGEENFLKELNDIIDSFQEAREEDVDVEEIEKFTSLRDYEKNINKLIFQKKKEKLNKDTESKIDQKEEEFVKGLSHPEQMEIRGLGKRLYVYGVLIKTKHETYVKFGDTRQNKEEDARKYALDATVGKARGLAKDVVDTDIEDLERSGKEIDDISLIFVRDVTDFAEKENPDYIHGDKKGFDHYLRPQMPGESGVITNSRGGRSLELHRHDPSETDLEITREWKKTLEDIISGEKSKDVKKKEYSARPFHNSMNEKIKTKESNKHLLGAATGAGKEAITLSSLIYINDVWSDLFNDDTIHVSTATIPSTELELFEELSNVSGMKMGDGSFIDFSRIKPYCLKKFADSYFNKLTNTASKWVKNNVTIIESGDEIESRSNDEEVPVLFGSFVHLGRQAKPEGDYKKLENRVGILSIGEAHQFLSREGNTLWQDINKNFKYKYLFLISGTPYDFIFNEAAHIYFSPEERTLFTRNDLYKAKEEGEKAFQRYPKLNYYKLDTSGIIQEMKKDPRWEDDKHGFTWDKFLKLDDSRKKFKYEQLIIKFFKRLFFVDDFSGEEDKLSIHNAPKLSEYAKRHVIVALPVGSGGISVHEYIPKLVELLEKNDALGNYKAFDVFDKEDDLSKLKEHIEKEKSPTILFTCNKLLTGTNIPQWGSLVFLRPIGGSIKFFEQSTGRVGRPFGKKDSVGIFLGNLELAAEIAIVVDEKILVERGEDTGYDAIMNQTLKNYNWFGVKNGAWDKFDMTDLVEAQEALAGDIDYGVKLAIGDTHPPKNFNLEFKSPGKNVVRAKIDIDSQDNKGAKNKERIETHKQLALKFEESKNPGQMWKNMIEQHIPKLLIIALLKDKHTIQEVGDLIEKAIGEDDDDILDMIGDGVYFVKDYINDKEQLNIPYLNRWISRLVKGSSNEKGFNGFNDRYKLINEDLDISRVGPSTIFDPTTITNEIVNEISNKTKNFKNYNNILILEKNGSFFQSFVENVGYYNDKNIYILTLDKLSEEIFRFLIKDDKKLSNIKFIKDINTLYKMKKFDVIIGNPPFQAPPKNKIHAVRGATGNLYQKFIELSCKIIADDGVISLVSPPGYLKSTKWGVPNKYFSLLKERGLSLIKLKGVKPHFNVATPMSYFISKKTKETEIISEEIINVDLSDKFFVPSSLDKHTYNIFDKVANNSGINLNFKRLSKLPKKYVAIKPMNNRLYGLKAVTELPKINLGNDLLWPIDNNENVKDILNSKTFTYLIRRVQYDAIVYFGFINGLKIPNDTFKKWSDKELYDFYKFSPEEIESIESMEIIYLQ